MPHGSYFCLFACSPRFNARRAPVRLRWGSCSRCSRSCCCWKISRWPPFSRISFERACRAKEGIARRSTLTVRSAFALGFSASCPVTSPHCCPHRCRYAVGGVELWEDYYKAMDSFKIGPKTWEAFRHDLACAKQGHPGGPVPRREAHAKPIVASDASDVIEMGECASSPSMISRDRSAA